MGICAIIGCIWGFLPKPADRNRLRRAAVVHAPPWTSNTANDRTRSLWISNPLVEASPTCSHSSCCRVTATMILDSTQWTQRFPTCSATGIKAAAQYRIICSDKNAVEDTSGSRTQHQRKTYHLSSIADARNSGRSAHELDPIGCSWRCVSDACVGASILG